MSEILSGKRQPDLIVCSKKGWDLIKESFKQGYTDDENGTLENRAIKSD